MANRPPIAIDAAVPRVDWLVWLVAASLLVVGWITSRSIIGPEREVTALDGEISMDLPAGWNSSEHYNSFTVGPAAFGDITPTVAITRLDVPDDGPDPVFVDLQMARIEQATANTGVGYRVLSTSEMEAFGGHSTSWTYYAMVREPPGSSSGAAVLPIVVQGVDVLVTTEDGQAFSVSASAPSDAFSTETGPIHKVLSSLRIGG